MVGIGVLLPVNIALFFGKCNYPLTASDFFHKKNSSIMKTKHLPRRAAAIACIVGFASVTSYAQNIFPSSGSAYLESTVAPYQFHIVNKSGSTSMLSYPTIPAVHIDDNYVFPGMTMTPGAHNIFEIYHQVYSGSFSGSPLSSDPMFLINTSNAGAKASLNKPLSSYTFDVGGDINADGSITAVGNVNVKGGKIDMTTDPSIGDIRRVITANSEKGGLSLQTGVPGGSISVGGAYIELHAGLEPGNPGAMDFSVTNGGEGYTFQSWDGHGWWNALMNIGTDGKVAIGQSLIWPHNTPGSYKLYVQDGILTEKLKVANIGTGSWADFVFANDYELMPLSNVEAFVKKNKHLPEIPSAEEVSKDGIDMVTMDAKLLQKIEELTLYVIDQQKQIASQNKEIELLKKKLN